MVQCLKCHRELKNEKSLEHQYGPVCWNRVHGEQKKKDIVTLERWFNE